MTEDNQTNDLPQQDNDTPASDGKKQYRRGIKSFVIRAGRLTKGQEGALERQWPTMGMELEDGPIDPQQVFGRDSHVVLEIGYGMGQSLVQMAAAAPEKTLSASKFTCRVLAHCCTMPRKRALLTCVPTKTTPLKC